MKIAKVNVVDILKAFLPVAFMVLALFAGFKAAHVHDREQSGWMMMLMFSLGMMVLTLEMNAHRPGWLGTLLVFGFLLFGIVFAVHWMGFGHAALRAIIESSQWVCEKISKVYADAFS